MNVNTAMEETELVDAAVAWLRDRLPSSWQVERSTRAFHSESSSTAQTLDAAIDVRANNGVSTTLAVEARNSFAPRDVDTLLPGLARQLRTLAGHIPLLVVAPWLSQRTRDLLTEEGINSIDLTGNAIVRLENPTLYIESAGAQRNPAPASQGRAQVRGPKAARLIRVLADVRPPYGVRELAEAAAVTPGYVSRILETLDREALVDRSPRGQVRSTDVAGLLRRWAQSYDVFETNYRSTFLAANGASSALDTVASLTRVGRIAVTGSFAATRLAPVAAPALLVAYCDDPQAVADALGLLPADEAPNVALLKPFDAIVWEGLITDMELSYVAPSQVVADCLTGTGRMPSEGEAVLGWMTENESRWRLSALDETRESATDS